MSAPPVLTLIADEFAHSHEFRRVSFEARGNFKETYQAIAKDGQVLALKLVDPANSNLSRTDREVAALKRCNSPYIAKLYDYGSFTAGAGDTYYFSLEEYLDGGTLAAQIGAGPLSLERVKHYALCLISALDHLKVIKLVHRDIKPDNVMFRGESADPVLVDFGLVRDLSESSLTQTWLPHGPGTPYYSAPEQLNNEKELISWRTDQFSLGLVLGLCLFGQHAFQYPGMSKTDAINAMAERRSCTEEFRDKARSSGFSCLVRMLEPWPVRRFSSPQDIVNSLPEV